MASCCPPGHGCNAPERGEQCALLLFSAAAPGDPDAAQALERWRLLVEAVQRGCGDRERRFLRRAFVRSRDRALIGIAMKTRPKLRAARSRARASAPRPHRTARRVRAA